MTPTLTALNDIIYCAGIEIKPITKANCETYGRKTMAYFRVADMATRRKLETILAGLNIYANPRYCTRAGNCAEDSPVLEVRVSYLRAKGWQE